MTSSVISFIAWGVVMVAMLAGLVLAARRSKGVQGTTEEIAAKALPQIGKIAEKRHLERFGCASSDAPGESGNTWYPEVKKKVAKAHVR